MANRLPDIPSVGGSIDGARELLGGALGTGSPREQVISAAVIGAFVILTSSIGLIGTILLLPIVFIWLAIGLLRYADPVDERWPLDKEGSGGWRRG